MWSPSQKYFFLSIFRNILILNIPVRETIVLETKAFRGRPRMIPWQVILKNLHRRDDIVLESRLSVGRRRVEVRILAVDTDVVGADEDVHQLPVLFDIDLSTP